MLRCVSIAPLATPVVPPVYCRNAMSSGPIGTSSQRLPAAVLARHVREVDRAARCATPAPCFFTCLTTRLTSSRLERRQQVADLGRDHVLDRGARQHLLQRVREVLQDHDRLRRRSP